MKSQIALVLLLSFLVVGYVLYEKDSNNSEPKTLSERGQDSLYNQPDSDVWLNVQNLSEQHPSVAGDRLNIRARVVLGATNKDVTAQDGIGVVVSTYRTELVGDTVSAVDTAGLSGSAYYDDTQRVWIFNSAKFPPGKYRYDITAYCVRSDLACGSWKDPIAALQVTSSAYFVIQPPHDSQVVSISKGGDLNQILPLNKPDQIFTFFTVNNLVPYTLVAHRAEFDVMFPITPQDLLRDITIVDENSVIVAGPVNAIDAGYQNQKQKIIFNGIRLRPGNHIYYLKGTTPHNMTTFSMSTTPVDDWSVEFEEVPGTYADLRTSATIFFEEVRIGM